jgi:Zn ribbon nucleic-acid-binding protein
MTQQTPEDLWRNFPKTAQEFERRFATEDDCRAYWIEARWGGKPACARCHSTRVWTERDGFLFECADCGHQTSLTSGTVLEKTRKPFKTWFRAVFEIAARRNGISAKDLQRILGFGSYKTAWTWLHKLRTAMVRSDSEPLGPFVQIDEALVGGKGGPHKELVLVAAEADGRVRLAHASNNDEGTLKPATIRRAWASGPTTNACKPRPSGAPRMPCSAATGRSRCSSAGCWGHTAARCATSTCKPISTSSPSATTVARQRASAALPPASSRASSRGRRCR